MAGTGWWGASHCRWRCHEGRNPNIWYKKCRVSHSPSSTTDHSPRGAQCAYVVFRASRQNMNIRLYHSDTTCFTSLRRHIASPMRMPFVTAPGQCVWGVRARGGVWVPRAAASRARVQRACCAPAACKACVCGVPQQVKRRKKRQQRARARVQRVAAAARPPPTTSLSRLPAPDARVCGGYAKAKCADHRALRVDTARTQNAW